MKAKLEVILRTTVMIEVPDSQWEELELLDYPMDVDDFEQATGLRIDPDDMLNPDSCEVEDIYFEKLPKSEKPPESGKPPGGHGEKAAADAG
jgi:hypothetical protein